MKGDTSKAHSVQQNPMMQGMQQMGGSGLAPSEQMMSQFYGRPAAQGAAPGQMQAPPAQSPFSGMAPSLSSIMPAMQQGGMQQGMPQSNSPASPPFAGPNTSIPPKPGMMQNMGDILSKMGGNTGIAGGLMQNQGGSGIGMSGGQDNMWKMLGGGAGRMFGF